MRKKKKNIVLEKLLVEDYAAEGRSLAKVDGKVIFIENVVPGDLVDVRLKKNKKDWAEGTPVHFILFQLTGWYRSARILGFAEAASGRCYRMKNNCNTSTGRWKKR